MAKILKITEQDDCPRYKVRFHLENPALAKQYSVSFLGSVREQWGMLDLFCDGSVLVLDGPIADPDGRVIPAQEAKLKEVAGMLKYSIENDIPGFKDKIRQIILFHQTTENLNFGMADAMDMALKGQTKMRFMARGDYRIFARIIRLTFDGERCSSMDEFDERVNRLFDDRNLILSIMKELQDRDRRI